MVRFLHLLILLLLQFCTSRLTISSQSSSVKFLPGFDGPLPFQLETGYVSVGEREEVQLFYYFVESESNPKEDPLFLWLTGGPGCSALSGIFYEIGPIKFKAVQFNGSLPTLLLNPNSWTKMASIIFLDLPVGTGFSYARTTYASHSTDLQLCDQAYEFMRRWLDNHAEFVSNPFYIAGDSYAGIPIPIITQLILNGNGNETGIKRRINIKGYVLGNPQSFPSESNYKIPFAHGMGLISNELYQSLIRSCEGEYREGYVDPNNIQCLQNLELFEECRRGIQYEYILESHCGVDSSSSPIKLPSERSYHNERPREHHSPLSTFHCRDEAYRLSEEWANDRSVRKALHIRKGSIGTWVRCNGSLPFTTTILDSRPYHVNVSNKGYPSLIYSGDHDMVVPHLSTQAWIRSLNYSVIDQWRSWKANGQIAGYTETYSNKMTFATVKGGGHTAPEYKPVECYAMIKRWISREPL